MYCYNTKDSSRLISLSTVPLQPPREGNIFFTPTTACWFVSKSRRVLEADRRVEMPKRCITSFHKPFGQGRAVSVCVISGPTTYIEQFVFEKFVKSRKDKETDHAYVYIVFQCSQYI